MRGASSQRVWSRSRIKFKCFVCQIFSFNAFKTLFSAQNKTNKKMVPSFQTSAWMLLFCSNAADRQVFSWRKSTLDISPSAVDTLFTTCAQTTLVNHACAVRRASTSTFLPDRSKRRCKHSQTPAVNEEMQRLQKQPAASPAGHLHLEPLRLQQ